MRRRGRGEGSIFQRKDGTWCAAVDLGYEGARRRRKYLYGRTRSEASAKLTAALTQRQRGLPLPSDRLTVGSYLDRWLTEVVDPTLRPRTTQSYRMVVDWHLKPALGRTVLTRLSPVDVQEYINAKVRSGLSVKSVKNHHTILRAALSQAERWGLVPRNVVKLVPAPRYRRPEVRPLTPEQARTLLSCLNGRRSAPLYTLAMATGLRLGEVLGLTWDDVDLEASCLTVRHTLQRYNKAYHLDPPKTARSQRTLPLSASLRDVLRRHRTEQLGERLHAGPMWDDSWNLVFCTETGAPLNGAVITRQLHSLLEAAGLPSQRFHDLRHGAATYMLTAGVPLRVVMDVLGHSGIAITADLYSHVVMDLKADAVARVADLLEAGGE